MRTCGLILCLVILGSSTANAQKNGYLGFRVDRVQNGGLKIRSFIKNTPAARMAKQTPPQLVTGDIMERLDGRKLYSVKDVFKVTDNMQVGDPPVKLELRMPNGTRYYQYISPSFNSNAACSISPQTASDTYNKGRPSGPGNGNPSKPGRPSSGPGRPSN